MCGITGIFLPGGVPSESTAEILASMTRAIAHRGPDGSGVWTAPGVGFGELMASTGVLVVNDPSSLAKALSKAYFQHFPEEVRPRTLISRTGADIDKPFTLQIRCHHNAIENMAYQHLIRIADRSQVVRFVPFMQHIHVGNKLVFLVIGKRNTCVFQQ